MKTYTAFKLSTGDTVELLDKMSLGDADVIVAAPVEKKSATILKRNVKAWSLQVPLDVDALADITDAKTFDSIAEILTEIARRNPKNPKA